jgi:hypothetical protein
VNSTSRVSCTGFVPETITGGSAAGQRVADRYKSRLEMKRTIGNADQRIGDRNRADLRVQVSPGQSQSVSGTSWFVPDFYRATRVIVDTLTTSILDRQDRKAGAR